ncbi:Glycosyltransferase involved in cell wall bisynthesis [Myroides marinus]|uniref:Glycosyltransferase involved in cell wall bisynthesis n=1 Tax=Myroides marinus TaxID=703342 RepID=A0A1H6XJC0_9FLAO|nr:glycosyltransferase [Myroides marinus]SEJ29201.1 Glycosyltransferase involved in cell wall bisynthesis [Myroides marinus]
MNVLHIIPTLVVGGAEKLLVDTMSIYKKEGVEAEVLVLKRVDSFLEKELLSKGVKVFFLSDVNNLYNPLLIFKLIPFLRNREIIHVHLFPTSYWVPIAKILGLSKAKLVFTEHSTFNKRRGRFIFRFFESFIYSCYSKVICITDATKDNLMKHLLFKNSKKFVVINNGIDVSYFRSTIFEDLNLFEKDAFKIIQVSSFRKEKDQLTVIKALASLPNDFKLVLVGEGILKDNLIALTNELGLEERVLFLGNRKDIAQLMKYSDVVVLSSNYEGFGIAALEGMATGRPTLASDISGVKEVVGDYGILFEKGNENQLADSILRLKENKEYYLEVAKKCQERASRFDVSSTVRNYIKVYKEA